MEPFIYENAAFYASKSLEIIIVNYFDKINAKIKNLENFINLGE